MSDYHIVLTTAEDIIAVVDAVVAKRKDVTKDFITDFTGIATEDQVNKAILMAIELRLLSHNSDNNTYHSDSFLAEKLVTSTTDEQKAVLMRMIIEQYEPYLTFKSRYGFTKQIDLACKQTKSLHNLSTNERDIKNTLISIATYAKSLKSEGAGLYCFVEEEDEVTILNDIMKKSSISSQSLRQFFGESICSKISEETILNPLINALTKTEGDTIDSNSVVVHAANAFESFLNELAAENNISLERKNGIIQKRDALNGILSKKHRGMIEFIGQIRNAADHGEDIDEQNQVWSIAKETAILYPRIVAILIRDIFYRQSGRIEV